MVRPRLRSAIRKLSRILMIVTLIVLAFYIGRLYERSGQLPLDLPKSPDVVKPNPSTKPLRKQRLLLASRPEMTEDRQHPLPVFLYEPDLALPFGSEDPQGPNDKGEVSGRVLYEESPLRGFSFKALHPRA